MKKVMKWLRKSQKGQTATEYMLIVGVIVIGLLVAAQKFVPVFGDAVDNIGRYVTDCVSKGECKFDQGQ